MPGILIRIIVAVISCLLIYALIGPVARVIGFDVSGDVMTIIRICVGGIAVFYIIWGSNPPWFKSA